MLEFVSETAQEPPGIRAYKSRTEVSTGGVNPRANPRSIIVIGAVEIAPGDLSVGQFVVAGGLAGSSARP